MVHALAALDPLKELPRSRTDAPASAAPYSAPGEEASASAASASAAAARTAAAASFKPPAPRRGGGKDSSHAMIKLARSLAELVGGDGGSAEAREQRKKRGPFYFFVDLSMK